MTEGQDLNTVLQGMNAQILSLQQAQAATTRKLEATKARLAEAQRVRPDPPRPTPPPLVPMMEADDIESYQGIFERTATQNEWQRSEWASILAPYLKGPTQRAYYDLPEEEAASYDLLKQEILAHYGITPGQQVTEWRSWQFDPEKLARAQAFDFWGKMGRWLRPEGPQARKVMEQVACEGLVNAMPSSLAQQVWRHPYKDMSGLLEVLERQLAVFRDGGSERQARGNRQGPPSPLDALRKRRREPKKSRPPRAVTSAVRPGTYCRPTPDSPERNHGADGLHLGHRREEVAVTNFSLHIVHCHRFLSICPLCDESVPSDQLEEHRDREHRKVQCIQCRKKIENYKLEIHKLEECLQRMNICPFCDLEMPFCKLSEHKAACGSRTQLCPDCNKYIKLVDEEKHYDDCPAKQQQIEQEENEDVKKQDANMGVYSFADRGSGLEHSCWYCMKSIPAAEIKKHEVKLLDMIKDGNTLQKPPHAYEKTPPATAYQDVLQSRTQTPTAYS
ncbi:XAF1 factor, partial [Polypterus senegalus]